MQSRLVHGGSARSNFSVVIRPFRFIPPEPSVETATAPATTNAQNSTFAPPVAQPIATPEVSISVWPLWQRVLFRFFAVYLVLQIAPWNWFRAVPGVPFVLRYYFIAVNKAVTAANADIFHVRETLVQPNGSGDTSWAWTQLWLYLSLAAIACVVWSVADRKRPNYARALYWLRLIVRY